MSVGVATPDVTEIARAFGARAKACRRALATAPTSAKDAWLRASAGALRGASAAIVEANGRDIEAARAMGLGDASIDRLRLDPRRVEAMAGSLEQVAGLPDPIGRSIDGQIRPNGLEVRRVRVPIGVILMIYESRPNVTVDAAALCLKSGNPALLKGGKEARETNLALHRLLRDQLAGAGLPGDAVQYIDEHGREVVGALLRMPEAVDLVIPRGNAGLIGRVQAEAAMPVLKHYQGNCHVFVDRSADLGMAMAIALNAKLQRTGVCNACETLLVHREIADRFLPGFLEEFARRGGEARGDEAARAIDPTIRAASEEDWGTEYLDRILAVKVVDDLDAAIRHIERYGSGHTDAIVTSDLGAARRFTAEVDSAAVLVNASTRFNDGEQLGLGAEIGISTDRIHARGPCGLVELTTTKWVILGDGHVRE